MAEAPLPAWTNGVLLENRKAPQTLTTELDMTPKQLFAQQLKIRSGVQDITRIKFEREGVNGIAEIGNNPAGLVIRTINTESDPPTNGRIILASNSVMNNLSTGRISAPLLKVPTSIVIKPDGDDPKENPEIIVQGSTTELVKCKLSFGYVYIDDEPNFVKFNLNFFPFPLDFAFFVKDSTGTNNLPGVVLSLDIQTSILTITGIPSVEGVCSAMLFFF